MRGSNIGHQPRRQILLATTVLLLVAAALIVFRPGMRNTGPVPSETKELQVRTGHKKPEEPVVVRVWSPQRAKSQDAEIKENKPEPMTISGKTAMKHGSKLLRDGKAPSLIGRFELPFAEYVRKVEERRGKLVVFDRYRQEVVGTLSKGVFSDKSSLRGYAARARDVTDDMPADLRRTYLQLVRGERGGGAYRFVVVLPEAVEAHFIGLIGEMLSQKGIDIRTVDTVLFSYHNKNNQIAISVDEVRQSGRQVRVGRLAYLWR